MRTSSQTSEEANLLIDTCIEGYVAGAEGIAGCYISGATLNGLLDVEMAARIIVQDVGRASHVYQDKTCPVHYENGEPHTWFGTWLIDWRHFPELFLYVPNSSIKQYKAWVESMFHRVLQGNEELINEIFE